MEFVYETFAEALKATGVPVTTMAEELGVHRSTIYYWLQGKKTPTLEMFMQICKKYDLEPCIYVKEKA